MFQTLKNAWKITELRSKMIFTILIIVLYRFGSGMLMPWVNSKVVESVLMSNDSILTWVNMLSGGAFAQANLFALSVSPYITASIVIQLLTVAIPKFEQWSKDGDHGKKILSAITRYTTIGLALITSIGYTSMLHMNEVAGGENNMLMYTRKDPDWFFKDAALVLCFCAGASVVMWLAEKINERGVGNGISIILFANILAGLPSALYNIIVLAFGVDTHTQVWPDFAHMAANNLGGLFLGIGITLLFVFVLLAATVFVVWFSNSERRIPIQYAKRVVGRKMYGGQSTNLPIKLNMSGVMPVIFASSIVSILPTIAQFIPTTGFAKFVNDYLGPNSFPYIALYLILTIAFAYFYTMISFNPVEVSNNLRNNGGAIPGIRPGKPTVDYIKRILNRITLLGALFLCILCGLPMIVNAIWVAVAPTSAGIGGLAFGGSSLLIVVGVALETFREIEAQITLRNYKGFLD